MSGISIDPARLLLDLDRLRTFGKKGTGVVRPAFTVADIEARQWLAARMGEAGLEPVFDPVANLFGLRAGGVRSILLGSHSDTQPQGGWLDGAFGVIAALEVARACQEANGPPVSVVSFQEEEGRFGGVTTGSRFWTGDISLEDADTLLDNEGTSFGQCRKDSAFEAGPHVDTDRFLAFVEPHIEQGPVLHVSGESVGVVDAIVGLRQVTVTFTGQQNHAGTTPMPNRRDAFRGLTQFLQELEPRFRGAAKDSTVWTVGWVEVQPNAASIIPGQVSFTVQWRDDEISRLDGLEQVVRTLTEQVSARLRLEAGISGRRELAPTRMDPRVVESLAAAANDIAPGRWRRIRSGALHDATNVSTRMPGGMLFVPSIGGISHSFDEDTDRDDLVLGAQVLAAGVERFAAEIL